MLTTCKEPATDQQVLKHLVPLPTTSRQVRDEMPRESPPSQIQEKGAGRACQFLDASTLDPCQQQFKEHERTVHSNLEVWSWWIITS